MNKLPSNNCYCLNQKSCNCCVSDEQFKASTPICPAERDVSSCKCNNMNGTLMCTCANQYFFNQDSIVSYKPQNCACFGAANQTTGLDCQCCSTFAELQPTPVCAVSDTFVNCQDCKLDAVNKTV